MTLRRRVHRIERQVGPDDKDPRDMSLAELYEACVRAARRHPPDRETQRVIDKLSRQLCEELP